MKTTATPYSTTAETNALNRSVTPPIVDTVDLDLHLKPYEKWVLANGVEVYAVNAGAEDVIQAEWIFFAGNFQEEQNMVAAATNHLLKHGTASKNAFQLNEAFEYYGAYLNRHCYSETASISLHSLTKYVPEVLPVIAEIINEASFAADELQLFKQNHRQRLEVSLKKCDFVANRLIDSYLFGEQHPYGRFSTYEALNAIEREHVVAFHDKYYRHGKCIMFVAGKLPADLFQQLDKNFGSLDFQPRVIAPDQQIIPAVQKKYRVLNDPDGVQGAIRLGSAFPQRSHPDYLPSLVLNNIFGGYFGSRLMDNIREDKGYTYGIHSFIQAHRQQSAWIVSTEAGRTVCEDAISEIYKEMEILRDEPVDDDELSLVKNYMMGQILGDLDGPFHIIGKWKGIIVNELGDDYFERSIETIRQIDAVKLQELANKYLKPEAFYDLLVV
jgi:zinc protease